MCSRIVSAPKHVCYNFAVPESSSAQPRQLGSTRCGGLVLHWGARTYIMGVLNVSPDSFSGDGAAGLDEAVARAEGLVADGADIIDVGGESTRPGAEPLAADEELRRVIPVLRTLRQKLPVPLSVDTYKAAVAREALDAGADMLNDIWGLKKEPELADLAAERDVPIVLMSNQRGDAPCGDIVATVIADLRRAMDEAVARGVAWENVIVDPGIGFGKTQEQNVELLRGLDRLQVLGRPILLGSSRKSFIGWVLDLTPRERSGGVPFVPPSDRRVEGTAATVAIGIVKGADMVRVHDVGEMVRVCRMSDAVVRGV